MCADTTQAARHFKEQEIDAEALVELDRADFESLFVSKIGVCQIFIHNMLHAMNMHVYVL